jgi:hypothetical protein
MRLRSAIESLGEPGFPVEDVLTRVVGTSDISPDGRLMYDEMSLEEYETLDRDAGELAHVPGSIEIHFENHREDMSARDRNLVLAGAELFLRVMQGLVKADDLHTPTTAPQPETTPPEPQSDGERHSGRRLAIKMLGVTAALVAVGGGIRRQRTRQASARP